ncbi:DNA-binding anti-repressor SinI [Halobacillus locisalis]|uniref:DNA-binding anti-repressor SinI n=2 Tax=Halobacillus locisalis TaxID=220753 RepID=A0A838CTQ8_9BACI|nr:DNA-binding anti-repressor SinI [Halobacillus locisalis]
MEFVISRGSDCSVDVVDQEWIALMKEAKASGFTKEEIQRFLNSIQQ